MQWNIQEKDNQTKSQTYCVTLEMASAAACGLSEFARVLSVGQ